MDQTAVAHDITQSIVKACHSGLPIDRLRAEVLSGLARVLPADAVWWAAVDPATLLFTNTYGVAIPADATGYFVENEFLHDDFNKWSELSRDRVGVRSLSQATGGSLQRSERYRDVFEPLGLGDELRTVLRVQGTTWGLLCLHREAGRDYARAEADWIRRLAPHLAEAMRVALLVQGIERSEYDGAPGLIILSPTGEIVGSNPAGDRWMDELGSPSGDRADLPIEVQAVAASLRSLVTVDAPPPRLRVRTRAGRWVVLHASWMHVADDDAIAVIVEEAMATEVAPVIMLAYGLTERERVVTGLVSSGLSTAEIATELRITADTVQDHLKSIFRKTGAGSRTELVATILRRQYLPRVKAGDRVAVGGFFD